MALPHAKMSWSTATREDELVCTVRLVKRATRILFVITSIPLKLKGSSTTRVSFKAVVVHQRWFRDVAEESILAPSTAASDRKRRKRAQTTNRPHSFELD